MPEETKGPNPEVVKLGDPGGILGTLIPANEEQREIPFSGVDATGAPEVYTFGGRHWQQGQKAPVSVCALIERRAKEIHPEQFEGKGSKPVESPQAAVPAGTVDALTAATGDREQAEKIASGDVGNIDAPLATQTVAESAGSDVVTTPGGMPRGSMPVEEEEEEETPSGSGKRKRSRS